MSEPTNEKGAGGDAPTPLRLSVAKSPARHQANSMMTASTARLSPGLALIFLTAPSRSARRMFSIFMASTTHKRVARLDFLALGDVDGLDQARHGAEQQLRGVGGGLLRHQGGERRLALGVDVGLALDAAIGEVVAVEDRANLHGDVLVAAPCRSRPARPATSPTAARACRGLALAVEERDLDRRRPAPASTSTATLRRRRP